MNTWRVGGELGVITQDPRPLRKNYQKHFNKNKRKP